MKFDKNYSSKNIKIIVKTNMPKTEIVEYDNSKKALKVNVHAKPDNNEANVEVIKFFSKFLKKKITIKSGTRSREKLLEIK